MLNKKIQMNNGLEIPVIGLGTWQTPNDITPRVIKEAIEVGYIHIDTAIAYRNEEGVGKGLKEANIKREDIYITSKIDASTKTYEGAKQAIQESLKRLNVEYIDLMLIHCPVPWALYAIGVKGYKKENVAVYKAMEEAYERGEIKSLGVSNFSIDDIQNILDNCHVKPVVNQIPWFIGCRDEKIMKYCHDNDILIESYSPLGTGRLLKNKKIKAMADKYHVTVAQLCIKFAVEDADITLPKTTHKEYMISNAQLDFEISPEDMEILRSM